MRPAVWSVVALVLTVSGGAGAPSLPGITRAAAAQGAENAAGLVIADPDGGVKTVCVRFSSESIDGEQLLNLADQQRGDIDPVYAQFGSKGKAVCALCGEGCPSEDCFCQDRYWNYNVAQDGRWVRSSIGVNSRTVRHGDVDGWAFGGDGAAPPYISFERICAQSADPTPQPTAASPTAPPPTTSPPPPEPQPTTAHEPSPPPATQAPAVREASPSATAAPATDADAGTPRPAPSVTAAPTVPPSPEVTASPTPTVALDEAETTDSGAALGVFAVVFASLIGAVLWQRRRREG